LSDYAASLSTAKRLILDISNILDDAAKTYD